MSLNKVMLIGNLGKDPEVRFLGSGSAVCEFPVATSERWTDKNGDAQERTEWHTVVAWGKLAEVCGEHLAKGRQVFIEGSIQTESWEDKESGQKRYRTKVKAQRVQFLGGRSGGSGGHGSSSAGPADDEDVPF